MHSWCIYMHGDRRLIHVCKTKLNYINLSAPCEHKTGGGQGTRLYFTSILKIEFISRRLVLVQVEWLLESFYRSQLECFQLWGKTVVRWTTVVSWRCNSYYWDHTPVHPTGGHLEREPLDDCRPWFLCHRNSCLAQTMASVLHWYCSKNRDKVC